MNSQARSVKMPLNYQKYFIRVHLTLVYKQQSSAFRHPQFSRIIGQVVFHLKVRNSLQKSAVPLALPYSSAR
jgi:hypothetical protein